MAGTETSRAGGAHVERPGEASSAQAPALPFDLVEGAGFCAPVASWFRARFDAVTEPQRTGWPAIATGDDALIAAPTGSGKTLSAFLVLIDRLVRRGLAGQLEDRLEAVYVSPLRALSHDIQRNLETPLAEIRDEAARLGLALPEIRTAVRTGDTPQAARQAMLRRPPHILVTTPESLYLLLTSERSRDVLRSARTVIVDEIHALARDKRGSHFALSLERLDALADARPQRIGLSATQRPMETIARFLVGARRIDAAGAPQCRILDAGHQRDLDLAVVVPKIEDLAGVASLEQWDDLLAELQAQIAAHRTTLVFVNTRRLAERLAHKLGEKMGGDGVSAHHGSLSRERRLMVETRLKAGDLRALVATASLELGIDIGSVDLVCQIGSPRSIATFLQRVGRSGHALGLVPKGRLFATTRDELVECAALVRAVRAGRLDAIVPPRAPLDILAQQIVASSACEEWNEDALFALVTGAAPYADLSRDDFDAVVELLARGTETPKGRRGAFLHRDRVQGVVRGRRGARLAAILSGGAIPDAGDYRVLLDPSDTMIGTVGEDFAVEAMSGDVFMLGTHSWRVRRVESGVLRVVDAAGAPPTIPFWVGEAPARTRELSAEVSSLRADVAADREGAAARLREQAGLCAVGAAQLVAYVAAQVDAIGRVPTCEDIVAERFFDESGGMQLVLHSPNGARINRALALALRKRFCKAFNQELQSAATDDAAVLSLGAAQTFPLADLPGFLSSRTLPSVLEQALLGTPLFGVRWRWNVTRALLVQRMRAGKRVPFPLQRMQAEDLLAAAFPEQTACQENVTYPIDIPDHPIVRQTLRDGLEEACDVEGAVELLRAIESGAARFHVIDTVEPSPFVHEIIGARPYAFLDDAPLEERRTQAVALRRVLPENARDLAALDCGAIDRVRDEAAPVVRSADELYELLLDLGLVRERDLAFDASHANALIAKERAARVVGADGARRLFAIERLPEVRALAGAIDPPLSLPEALERDVSRDDALDLACRGHLAIAGPIAASALADRIGATRLAIDGSVARIEGRGIALRGSFDPRIEGEQLCDRSLLARIHRYTIATLRREIEPVSAHDFLRFLLRWQHVEPASREIGEGGLLDVVRGLSGFEAPAAAWESELLSARMRTYRATELDALCLSGAVAWGRLSVPDLDPKAQSSRATPISLFPRTDLEEILASALCARGSAEGPALRGTAQRLHGLLAARGALFGRELESVPGLLAVQIEEGLRELIAHGLVTCDGFAPLRRLFQVRAPKGAPRRGRSRTSAKIAKVLQRGRPVPEGRWSLLRPLGEAPDLETRAEATARRLLVRYGVVFRDLLAREAVPETWREVHRALRRLEARGIVRGGRFVSGFTGEQFALPEAIGPLREARRAGGVGDTGAEIRISAADPLNLAGILTPGPRVPAGHTRWVWLRDGLPIAVEDRGKRSPLGAAGAPGDPSARAAGASAP